MNSFVEEEKIEWESYYFEPFGLRCDIFKGASVAIMIDPKTPLTGYLSQSLGPLMLMVSYGTDSGLDNWAQRIIAQHGSKVFVYEERSPATVCARAAERMVLKVEPEFTAQGFRFKDGRVEELSAENAEPYLMAMIGTYHRRTPLLAMFRKPLAEAELYESAEAHFFESFRCEP